MADDSWLIVGLGNPGPAYAAQRHNVGQMVLDELAGRMSIRFGRSKANAVEATGRLSPGAPRLTLAKPLSFMNLSGGPVSQLTRFAKIPLERVVVIHDELDLPFDSVRLKLGGGHGGHNGLRDIIAALGSPDFLRVRVGIGRPPGRQDAADFVLKPFTSAERDALPSLISDAAGATEALVTEGLTVAQQRWHAPRP